MTANHGLISGDQVYIRAYAGVVGVDALVFAVSKVDSHDQTEHTAAVSDATQDIMAAQENILSLNKQQTREQIEASNAMTDRFAIASQNRPGSFIRDSSLSLNFFR